MTWTITHAHPYPTLFEAFDGAAKAGLRHHGERPSDRAVAAIIGEHSTYYSAIRRGENAPSTAKVLRWLQRWNATDRASIELHAGGDGVVAKLVLQGKRDVEK